MTIEQVKENIWCVGGTDDVTMEDAVRQIRALAPKLLIFVDVWDPDIAAFIGNWGRSFVRAKDIASAATMVQMAEKQNGAVVIGSTIEVAKQAAA